LELTLKLDTATQDQQLGLVWQGLELEDWLGLVLGAWQQEGIQEDLGPIVTQDLGLTVTQDLGLTVTQDLGLTLTQDLEPATVALTSDHQALVDLILVGTWLEVPWQVESLEGGPAGSLMSSDLTATERGSTNPSLDQGP